MIVFCWFGAFGERSDLRCSGDWIGVLVPFDGSDKYLENTKVDFEVTKDLPL
jgi:hypothetical protein